MGTAMQRLKTVFLIEILLFILSAKDVGVLGHGRMMNPPSRNSMWRLGFQNPPDYNDNELYCGGFSVQWQQNGGKCGVCGDAYHLPKGQKEHEAGGKYANGKIVRTYSAGQNIDVEIELTANHQGFFEIKLCPHNNYKTEASQDCFDQFPLYIADTKNTRFEIPINSERRVTFNYKVRLPPYITCTQCVVQWTYYTANTWGTCPDGTEAVGCGPRETFRNCADVRIVTSSSGLPPNAVNPKIDNVRFDNYRIAHINDYRLIYQVCKPNDWQKKREGIDLWCAENCFHNPRFCHESYCVCHTQCKPIGDIANKPGAEAYCLDNCLTFKGECPKDRCYCY